MDVSNNRLVLCILGCISSLCIGGVVITQVAGHDPHPALGYTIVACVGAIVGVLVPSSRQIAPDYRQQATIANSPAAPVP